MRPVSTLEGNYRAPNDLSFVLLFYDTISSTLLLILLSSDLRPGNPYPSRSFGYTSKPLGLTDAEAYRHVRLDLTQIWDTLG